MTFDPWEELGPLTVSVRRPSLWRRFQAWAAGHLADLQARASL